MKTGQSKIYRTHYDDIRTENQKTDRLGERER